jgi:hypothetical protein
MARSTRRTSSRTTTSPGARTTVRKTEVEVVEKPGMGWETGVAILTGVLILVACLIVDFGLGRHYGSGLFFK